MNVAFNVLSFPVLYSFVFGVLWRGGEIVAWRELNENIDTRDDRFAESEEEVIGVCWYCGAKLREGYDYDVVCRECLGEEEG